MNRQRHRDSAGSPTCDQALLRDRAYADDSHLDVRYRTHQLYTVDPVDFGRWTLEKISWRGGERILDAGCGPGDLLRHLARLGQGRLRLGFDLSAGMVVQARRTAPVEPVSFLVADIQSIPLPDGTFDVVMARHMLYHVPDIERAISEVARLLRPGGQFLVTTNSAQTMPQYQAILQQAAVRCPAMIEPNSANSRFSLENAVSFLEPYFSQIEQHTLTGILRFPKAEPLVAYVASSRDLIMRPGHTETEWHTVLDFVHAAAAEIIAKQGCLDVTKITGAVTGRMGA